MRTKRLAVALATLLIPAASLLAQGPDVIKSLVNGQTTNRTNIGLIGADLIANAAHDREQDATILRMTQVIAELKGHKSSIDTATATADPAAIETAVKDALAKFAPAATTTTSGDVYNRRNSVLFDPMNAARWILGKDDAETRKLVHRLATTDVYGKEATSDTVRIVGDSFKLTLKGVDKLIARLVGHAIHVQQQQLEVLTGRVDDIDGRVTLLERKTDTRVDSISTTVDANEASIVGMISRVGDVETKVASNATQIANIHKEMKVVEGNFDYFAQRADETDEARRLRIQTLEATKADTIEGVNVLNRQAVVLGMAKLSGKGNHREIREEAANVAAKIKTATALIAATDAEITYLQGLLTPPPPAATP